MLNCTEVAGAVLSNRCLLAQLSCGLDDLKLYHASPCLANTDFQQLAIEPTQRQDPSCPGLL